MVERYVTEPYRQHQGFLAYAPHGNTIYAYDGGALWKWSGKQFEAVGLQEQQRLAIDQKEFSKEDYSNVNGWSLRHSLKGWPPDFNIELQGKAVTILPKQKDSGKELSLEILLPNGTSQTILHVKGDFHLVSKLEYQRDFGTP